MSYALSRPTTAGRSGLLGVVIGAHIGVILIIMAAKTVAPQIMEMPLIVDLIQTVQAKPPQAKPQPVTKPQPVRQTPSLQRPQPLPVIEATQSNQPAPNSPIATPLESKPAPPAVPAPEPISQARFDADYLKNPAPTYPPLSRRMGEEGKVVLRVSVSAQGTAESVEIKTSSGSQRLDAAAQKTVRVWKFIPAKRADIAIQSFVLVPIIFKLEQ